MLSTRSFALRVALCAVTAAVSPSINAAPPDDACSLLASAQVGAALGVPVGAGTYVTPTFKKTCTWQTTAGSGEIVTLNLQSVEQYEAAKKSVAYGNSVSPISIGGGGDEAYYLGLDALMSLMARKGDVAFKVAVYARIPIEKRQAAEKTLALQVLSHL